MKRKRLLLAALVVLAVFAFSQAAFAAGWGGGPRMLSGDRWVNLADTLGLTSEQAEKVQELQKDHFSATQDLRAKLQQLMFELRSLRWQPGADQTTVDTKLKEVNDLRSQLNEDRQDYQTELKAVLTEDQLSQLGTQCAPGSGRRGGGMGGGRGGMGGGFGGACPYATAPTQS